MLLALDTSTRFAGIALYAPDRGGLIAETNWHAGMQHTVSLMPRVSGMLEAQGAQVSDLTAIAVALGPGSFTGLRVGLAAAKGLALAAGFPIIGVPTLDATAYPHLLQPLPVIAVVQAGRGRVCWARYDAALQEPGTRDYTLSDVPGMATAVQYPALFTGELSPADRAALTERVGEQSRITSPALAMRRAGYLAEIAQRRLAAGEHDDIGTLNAIYLQELPGAAGSATS
jgi:tRNA threonylcarbamoyladenosine biosynthesis protein TsaB